MTVHSGYDRRRQLVVQCGPVALTAAALVAGATAAGGAQSAATTTAAIPAGVIADAAGLDLAECAPAEIGSLPADPGPAAV